MALQIQKRRDTSSNWNEANPILAQGEFGLEIESLVTPPLLFKVGDGLRNWNDLPYANTGSTQETKIENFVATQNQSLFNLNEAEFQSDVVFEVKVNGVQWNSRTGTPSFEEGNISIDFAGGQITFHVPLDEGDQVVVKYN